MGVIGDLAGKIFDTLKQNPIIWVAIFMGFLFVLSTTGNFIVGLVTAESIICGSELQDTMLGLGNISFEQLDYQIDNNSIVLVEDFVLEYTSWQLGTIEWDEDTNSFNRSDAWIGRSIYVGIRSWISGIWWLLSGHTDIMDSESFAEPLLGENYKQYGNSTTALKQLLQNANFTITNSSEYNINELMAIKCPNKELTLLGFPIFSWRLQFIIILLGFISVFAIKWYQLNKV